MKNTHTERELVARGFSAAAMHAAIRAGTLRASMTGTTFVVGDDALTEWIKADCPTTATARGRATRATTTPAATASDPVSEFDRAVRERMAKGMTRLDACVAVARANPSLHEAFVFATNASATAAPAATATTAGADPIEAFDKAVRDRVAKGQDRLAACVAAAKADPQLHARYLEATNRRATA